MENLETLLREIHKLTAEDMLQKLKDNPSSAELGVITKFLKDNGIAHIPESTDALQEAAEAYEHLRNNDDYSDPKHLAFPQQG